jgi:HD-like signal output (HDOD) protein
LVDRQTVRIVLTKRTERDSPWRLVHTAHQFLAKPSDTATLKDAIERACNLNALLLDDKLRGAIGQMGQLPALPSVVAELNQVLANPDCSMKEIAGVIGRDPALCAKILQLVNSSFFGLPQKTASLEHAVSYLGIDVLTGFTMTIEIEGLARDHPRIPGFTLEHEYDHSIRTARIARQIGTPLGIGQDSYIAGMLHDVGRLVLAARAPDLLKATFEEAARSARPLVTVEEEILGVTHAELGGYLLGLWGLPLPIVEAVAFHHRPDHVVPTSIDLLGVVHVADFLADDLDEERKALGITEGPVDSRYRR